MQVTATSSLVGKSALCSALLGALFTANPCYAEPPFHSFGGGAFIGYGGNSLIWGLEAFATHTFDHRICSSEARWGLGPLARVTLHGASRPSFTLTAHGGRDLLRPVLGVSAEAGLTLAFRGLNGEPEVSPHTGISVETLILQSFSHQEWLLPEFTVGGGARYFPTTGTPGMCAIGRPQRNAQGDRVATRWRRDRCHKVDNFRKALVQEYSSVPAFLQLALELCMLEAPNTLVRRALASAWDELHHTLLCARALTHLSGEVVEILVTRAEARAPLFGRAAYQRLALESWLDGCLGEGSAAAFARREALEETDPVLASIHETIARDEQRHAELGWDILRFCIQRESGVRALLLSVGNQVADATALDSACVKRHEFQSRCRLHSLCA